MELKGPITIEHICAIIKERRREAHKGDFGKVLVVAGGAGMAGAAVLCGKAAYKAGAGLVAVSVHESLYPVMHAALPEAICVPRRFPAKGFSGYDAVAVGPGLGTSDENDVLISRILSEYEGTVVLDADGLNAVARCGPKMLLDAAAKVVLTPHMGEAKRLLSGKWRKEWQKENLAAEPVRLKIAETLVDESRAVVVLKGAGTIVASMDCGAFKNTTGNPGMATGGSGDVLSGIVAGFAGQGMGPWDAAKAGAFIHGLAGDKAARAYGEYGMTAMDVADMTAFAIKDVIDRKRRGDI